VDFAAVSWAFVVARLIPYILPAFLATLIATARVTSLHFLAPIIRGLIGLAFVLRYRRRGKTAQQYRHAGNENFSHRSSPISKKFKRPANGLQFGLSVMAVQHFG
jgi:hypothetical protein